MHKEDKSVQSYQFEIDNIKFTLTKDSSYLFKGEIESSTNIHKHADYELFFNFDGELYIQTNTNQFTFNSKTLVIIPPTVYHYTTSNKECYRFLLNFNSKNNENSNELNSVYKDIFMPGIINSYSIEEDLKVYCKELNNCFNGQLVSNNIRIICLFKILLLKISDFSNKKNILSFNSLNSKANYLYEINRFIDKNYMHDIKLIDAAKEISLSERQTSRIIKKNYNKTFSDILIEKRLSVASLLLIKTNNLIKQIISEVNFKNESYFYIIFKRLYNISPLQYRKKYQKNGK